MLPIQMGIYRLYMYVHLVHQMENRKMESLNWVTVSQRQNTSHWLPPLGRQKENNQYCLDTSTKKNKTTIHVVLFNCKKENRHTHTTCPHIYTCVQCNVYNLLQISYILFYICNVPPQNDSLKTHLMQKQNQIKIIMIFLKMPVLSVCVRRE